MKDIGCECPKYIFVAGLPRAGTTLVQTIIANHPQVFTLPETHFFEEVGRLGLSLERLTVNHIQMLFDKLEQQWEISVKKAGKAFATESTETFPAFEVFKVLIESYRPGGAAGRALRGLEKTPGHLYTMEHMLTSFPHANAVLLKRNPVDFVASLRRYRWAPSSIDGAARLWANGVETIRRISERYHDRVIAVDYEELVAHPEVVSRRIFNHTGLSFDTSYLEGLNARARQFIVNGEKEWKGANLVNEGIQRPMVAPSIALRDRAVIHRVALPTAWKLGQLRYYRW